MKPVLGAEENDGYENRLPDRGDHARRRYISRSLDHQIPECFRYISESSGLLFGNAVAPDFLKSGELRLYLIRESFILSAQPVTECFRSLCETPEKQEE